MSWKTTPTISLSAFISYVLSSWNIGVIMHIIKLLKPVVLGLFESSEVLQDNFLSNPLLACVSASDTSVKKSNNITFYSICSDTLNLIISILLNKTASAHTKLSSHAEVFRGSSRVPATRRRIAWRAKRFSVWKANTKPFKYKYRPDCVFLMQCACLI